MPTPTIPTRTVFRLDVKAASIAAWGLRDRRAVGPVSQLCSLLAKTVEKKSFREQLNPASYAFMAAPPLTREPGRGPFQEL